MSPVEPVAPPADRPPSRPSRLPLLICGGIALLCLVLFGTALVLFLWSRDEFDSRDLKKATAFRITYVVQGNQTKTVEVSDPAAVRELANALDITDTIMGAQFAAPNKAAVDVTLPNGRSARLTIISPTQIDRMGWGAIMVTPSFYRKVNEAASKAAGKSIDLLRVDN